MSQSPIESLLAAYGFDNDWHMDMFYFRHVFVKKIKIYRKLEHNHFIVLPMLLFRSRL